MTRDEALAMIELTGFDHRCGTCTNLTQDEYGMYSCSIKGRFDGVWFPDYTDHCEYWELEECLLPS